MSAPVHAADPSKPNVFGQLPDELWQEICNHLVGSLTIDFVMATGSPGNKNMKPLNPGNEYTGDALLHGLPFDGKLYITKVSPCPECFLGEPQKFDANRQVCDVEGNGPWYSHLGQFEPARPRGALRHRFFKDADGTVKMFYSMDEVCVNNQRHRTDELRITDPSGYPQQQQFRMRMIDRCLSVENDPRFKYMPIPEASTSAGQGHLTLLALCKGLQLRCKLTIVGIMPLMTRLRVYNHDDETMRSTTPFDMTACMRYTDDKWLVAVPLRWMCMLQWVGDYEKRSDSETQARFVQGCVASDASFFCGHDRSIVDCVDLQNTHPLNPVKRNTTEYPNTPFECLSAAMVYTFFASPLGTLNPSDASAVGHLLFRADTDTLLQQEYSRNGNRHVCSVPQGDCLRPAIGHTKDECDDDLLSGFVFGL